MAVTVSILGSGSKGNATFIKTDRVRLIVDAGFSRKELGARLEAIGEDPDGIDAALITHEHADHVSAIKGLLKELPIQAHMTWGTIRALGAEDFELNGSSIVPIQPRATFTIGDVEVYPFAVPHDAAEPVAYPAKGQSAEQQTRDEHACHEWAQKETGVARVAVAEQSTTAAGSAKKDGMGSGARGAGIGAMRGAADGNAGAGAVQGDPRG